MNKIRIWDYPIRIFHWAFAFSLSLALALAFWVDDDSALFDLHKLLGLTAGFLLVIRVVIGLFGSKPTRFRGLLFGPMESLRYAVASLVGRARSYAGHNPGTAAAALVMFVATGGLVWTGLTMGGEGGEELHEWFANILLAAIGAHLAGLVLHTFHHREWIGLSMITGWRGGQPEGGIRSFHPAAGGAVLALLLVWAVFLTRGYQPSTATVHIPLFGVVSLDGGDQEHTEPREGHHDERDDDDD